MGGDILRGSREVRQNITMLLVFQSKRVVKIEHIGAHEFDKVEESNCQRESGWGEERTKWVQKKVRTA